MIPRALCFVTVLLVQSAVFADAVPSTIDAVVVFPDGAMVTRRASVSLAAGDNEVKLGGLAAGINFEQLRVEVSDDDVRIGQVNLSIEQSRDVLDAEIAALQEEIDAVREQMTALGDSTSAAKLQLKFLDGIATGYGKDAGYEGSRGTANVAAWKAALDLLLTESQSAGRLIRDNENKASELAGDLSLLQRKMAALRGGQLSSSTLDLTLVASRPLQSEIIVRYFQADASWSPRYEARLDSDTGDLQLLQQAVVAQETSEEWDNVAMTLSTNDPSQELVAPDLDSQFVNLYDPRPERKLGRVMSSQSVGIASDGFVEEVVVTGNTIATVGNFAVNYEVPGRTSLTNDADEEITIDLAQFGFAADLVTQVVPRESTQAFLAARFIYDEGLPLYSSEMTVYVDGAFTGNTIMPTALPDAEVVLPMGQDRRVTVTAESQGGSEGQSGIIGRRKSETTDYLFEITNRRAKATQIEVMDLYPVSRNKDIDVDVPRTATPPDERDIDDQPGLVAWKKSVGPGESWRIRHQYTITWPANRELLWE